VVERLIGPDIQLQQSRLILKPRTPQAWFDWHQDYPAFPHTNFDLLIVTVYLDDSSPDNGCLTVIPGSHRLGPLPHRFTFEGAARTQVADRRVVADRSRWRRTPVPAGGIEVHHGNLLHSSEANLTDHPRSDDVSAARGRGAPSSRRRVEDRHRGAPEINRGSAAGW
jgi:phytanoyl-CoA hydroxylase